MNSHASYAISHIIKDPELQLAAVKLERQMALVSEMLALAIEFEKCTEKTADLARQWNVASDGVSKRLVRIAEANAEEQLGVLKAKFLKLRGIYISRYGTVFANTNTIAPEEKITDWLPELNKILLKNDEKLQDIVLTIANQFANNKKTLSEEKSQNTRPEGELEPGAPPPYSYVGTIATLPEKSATQSTTSSSSSLSSSSSMFSKSQSSSSSASPSAFTMPCFQSPPGLVPVSTFPQARFARVSLSKN